MASSYEISLSSFSDQKTLWNDENATGKKKYNSCAMNVQSPLHSNRVSLKKRKMAFFESPPRKESWENSSNLWLPTLQLLGSTHSWCFRVQTIFQMQQCKPSTISLGSQDLRKAEAELLQSLPLEKNGMLYFYVHIFFLVCETFRREMWFYFQPSLWFNF